MIAIVPMLLAILPAQDAPPAADDTAEMREFRVLGAIVDDAGDRSARVHVDRDRDADGMADEGVLHVTCRAGKVAAATFVAGAGGSTVPVGRRSATPPTPSMTARYAAAARPDAPERRLTAITTTGKWCPRP